MVKVTITATPASNGSIKGFAVTCECGDKSGWSLETMANSYANKHIKYHAEKVGA